MAMCKVGKNELNDEQYNAFVKAVSALAAEKQDPMKPTYIILQGGQVVSTKTAPENKESILYVR